MPFPLKTAPQLMPLDHLKFWGGKSTKKSPIRQAGLLAYGIEKVRVIMILTGQFRSVGLDTLQFRKGKAHVMAV
jgi:hypothetical protein